MASTARTFTRHRLLPAAVALLLLILAAGVYWQWLMEGSPSPATASQLPVAALQLTVRQAGMTAVRPTDLAGTGWEQPFEVEHLRLTRDGRSVPFVISGDGEQAVLFFYSQPISNTAEGPAVYQLAPGQGQVMNERTAAPTGAGPVHRSGWRQQRWEENRTFLAQSRGDDTWLWELLFAPQQLDVPLAGITPNGGPAEITVRFWSDNRAPQSPDHHVLLSVNGRQLADHYWDGIRQETVTTAVPTGLLKPDGNVLTIDLPGDTEAVGEKVYLDWVELHYESDLVASGQYLFAAGQGEVTVGGADGAALIFDVTAPDAPIWLRDLQFAGDVVAFASPGDGRQYILLTPDQAHKPQIQLAPQWPGSLRDPGRGADFIAILPDDSSFGPALQPLLDHRATQGLRVTAVPLAQIYDEFGHGRQTTAAIRDFLAYAVAEWSAPAPRYVLLAGDASYDIHQYNAGKNRNLIPTHLIYTEYAGHVASDTWFTLFGEDKLAPALAIGRFPAQNSDQLAVMVDKTLAYERQAGADWLRQALLVADGEPAFDRASDRLAGELQNHGFAMQKLYKSQQELDRDDIVAALDAGVGIVNYVGHGGVRVWSQSVIFDADDAYALSNGRRVPIFTTFTCLNGYFNHPDVDSLAETLLWAENGGIVAAVVPSGRSFTSQQMLLADVFYEQLLGGEVTLGEALVAAKIASADRESQREVIHTFNLLGDPALQFQRP